MIINNDDFRLFRDVAGEVKVICDSKNNSAKFPTMEANTQMIFRFTFEDSFYNRPLLVVPSQQISLALARDCELYAIVNILIPEILDFFSAKVVRFEILQCKNCRFTNETEATKFTVLKYIFAGAIGGFLEGIENTQLGRPR
jgi:hypothetical protein